ncbi:MAG: lamin tail domain-containing protein [Caldilineaceae bacterium]|nr:lamin tail domain-containing protein [Caldilineaceae bacterium]
MRHTQPFAALIFAIVSLFALTGPMATAQTTEPAVLISQVYGGGGNSGAEYTHDFIELFNPGESAVALAGWSVQYASATGTVWQKTELTGTIQPGGYYLIQQAQGNGGRTPLPRPDAIGTIAMSASSGKVALLHTTELLARGTACPEGNGLVDLVGFGNTDCFSGQASALALNNRSAALRLADGCTQTASNGADFSPGPPVPRNSASGPTACGSTSPAIATPVNPPISPSSRAALTATAPSLRPTTPQTGTLPFAVTPTPSLRLTSGISVTSPAISETLNVRISQLYGGGGNAGATFTHDFIELHNPGSAAVDVSGWSIQYASATGKSWLVTPLSGTIPAGGFYLIQQAQGAGGRLSLPPADALGETAMSASGGKVALVAETAPLTGVCPNGQPIVDFVGYGSADCFEGNGPAPRPSNTLGLHRIDDDSQETDDNRTDFVTAAPLPRRSD